MVRNDVRPSLQNFIDSTPDLVDFFYHQSEAAHTKHKLELSPIKAEFSNWRDEQRGWRETAILFDQSHHMPELFLTGPDALTLLTRLGINSFKNFAPGRAKQFVACNARGQIIGECILYYLAEDSFELVSGMTLLNWVHYNAETGGYDVKVVRDNQTSGNPTGRRIRFRFGLDGPNARKVLADAVEGDAPEVRFFRSATAKIAGRDVLLLGHGMAGHEGVEISGAYDDSAEVRAALISAGEAHGLVLGGSRTYFSTLGESGWMPYPLPAIYTGEDMRGFREWLDADGWESRSQIGGSFRSRNIEDYYVTPWDLAVDRLMKFDHDFIGREALEAMAGEPHRTKVTLVWDKSDVVRLMASQLEVGSAFKAIELPVASYSFQQADAVIGPAGGIVGLSAYCGYTVNEAELLSLAMVDTAYSTPGTRLTVLWGEPDGGSSKSHVERHRQTTVNVTVAPSPYSLVARAMKAGASDGDDHRPALASAAA